VHRYFCGCNTSGARNPLRLLQYMCNSIMIHFDLGHVLQELEAVSSPIKKKMFERQRLEKARKQLFDSSAEVRLPYKYPFLCALFRKLVAAVSDSVIGDELLLLVDAVDCLDAAYLEPWPDSSLFDWLPPRLMDHGYPVRIIMSCQSGPAMAAVEYWATREGLQLPMAEITLLTSDESTELVQSKLSVLACRDGEYLLKQMDAEAERAAKLRQRKLRDAPAGDEEEEEQTDLRCRSCKKDSVFLMILTRVTGLHVQNCVTSAAGVCRCISHTPPISCGSTFRDKLTRALRCA